MSEEVKVCTTSGEPVDKVRAEQTEDTGQYKAYLVLCAEEREKGFVRPLRRCYIHVGVGGHEIDPDDVSKHGRTGDACGAKTSMSLALSETYARNPNFYGATFCCGCNVHLPVAEFVWDADGEAVGS